MSNAQPESVIGRFLSTVALAGSILGGAWTIERAVDAVAARLGTVAASARVEVEQAKLAIRMDAAERRAAGLPEPSHERRSIMPASPAEGGEK